jgi:hypothetical protein
MAKAAEQDGILMAKINFEGALQVRKENGETAIWGWHIAPVAYVRDESGAKSLMVFDPSLFERPVPLSVFKQRLLVSTDNVKPEIERVAIGSRFQYFQPMRYITSRGVRTRIGENCKEDWNPEDFDGPRGVEKTFQRLRPLQGDVNSEPISNSPNQTRGVR